MGKQFANICKNPHIWAIPYSTCIFIQLIEPCNYEINYCHGVCIPRTKSVSFNRTGAKWDSFLSSLYTFWLSESLSSGQVYRLLYFILAPCRRRRRFFVFFLRFMSLISKTHFHSWQVGGGGEGTTHLKFLTSRRPTFFPDLNRWSHPSYAERERVLIISSPVKN